MQLRDALVQQAPSLALQRAAADEIARLDQMIILLEEERDNLSDRVDDLEVDRNQLLEELQEYED